ncbi:MAG TPA: DUF58 domain-containing protein [Bacteriovoracaceae bacterium]|nr:DUF58 domain-containing protein [Bacteriovoracaceae bacterium]
MKKRGRIYILPTRMGGYFNALIFLMFLLSVGYSNNLLLIFTLFLFGLNLLWVIQTHFHLQHLKLEMIQIQDGHANEAIPFTIVWKHVPEGPMKWQIKLDTDKGEMHLKDLVQSRHETQGDLKCNQRGLLKWNYLFIATEKPFGLYRAWRHLKLDGISHIYPPMSQAGFNTPLKGLGLEGETASGDKGTGDFRDLLPYHGNEARLISWKHYARTGELLVKEGEEHKAPFAELKWDPDESPDTEESLSSLATQMVICHREAIPFTFEIFGKKRGPSVTARHLALCLQDLSQC